MGVAEWKREAPGLRIHSREGDGNPRMHIKINYRKYTINISSHRRPQGDSYVKLISLYLFLSHLLCTMKSPNYWYRACMLSFFSHVLLFVTPWTVTCQAPLSMGFPRQEYCSGLPSSRGIFQTQGSNPHLLCLQHCQVDSLPLSHLGVVGVGSLLGWGTFLLPIHSFIYSFESVRFQGFLFYLVNHFFLT